MVMCMVICMVLLLSVWWYVWCCYCLYGDMYGVVARTTMFFGAVKILTSHSLVLLLLLLCCYCHYKKSRCSFTVLYLVSGNNIRTYLSWYNRWLLWLRLRYDTRTYNSIIVYRCVVAIVVPSSTTPRSYVCVCPWPVSMHDTCIV